MRPRLLLLALAALISLAAPAVPQERRVALVVRTDSYRHITPLTNAVSDALAMAARLSSLGYEVIGPVLNPTRTELVDAQDRLEQRLSGDTVGRFFYAGHAVEVDDRNVLLAVDAPAAQPRRQIEAGGGLLGDILNEMQQAVPRVIAILDACRGMRRAAAGP